MESGLIHLKAELLRKKLEIKKYPRDDFHPAPLKPTRDVKNLEKPKSKSGKSRVEKESTSELDQEEALNLEKSRKALEEKAALYDYIKNGTEVLEDDSLNQKFLIDFQGKINYEVSEAKKQREQKEAQETISDEERNPEVYKAKDSSEEWVEYIDEFGRTRTCQRKDLEYLKGKKLLQKEESSAQSKIQQRWNKIEEDNMKKSAVHYQDLLFDEARSHGAGFMPFSRDQEERAAQQQLLKDLGTESQKVRVTKEAMRKEWKKMMKQRLAKVRQRKRLKMGLPAKDHTFKTPPPSDDEEESQPVDASSAEPDTSASADVPNKKPPHIREWDLGKPGVGATLSQEQWVDSKRKERENEFAPPSSYQEHTPGYSQKEEGKLRNLTGCLQYSSVSRSCSQYSYGEQEPKSDRTPQESQRVSSSSPQHPSVLQNPQTSCSSAGGFTRFDSETKRPEFAPPSSYDYYRPATTKRRFSLGTKIDMESAIIRGISNLRKEFEGNKN